MSTVQVVVLQVEAAGASTLSQQRVKWPVDSSWPECALAMLIQMLCRRQGLHGGPNIFHSSYSCVLDVSSHTLTAIVARACTTHAGSMRCPILK